MTKVIMFVMLIFLILWDLHTGLKLYITRGSFLASLFIYLVFAVSFFKFDYWYTRPYFFHFMLYSLFAQSVLQKKINFQRLIEYLAIVLFFALPVAFNVQDKTVGYLLGASYNMLIGYLCSMYYVFLNKTSKNTWVYFICIINLLVCSFFYLLYGNRGAILMIIVYLFLKWFLKYSTTLKGKMLQILGLTVSVLAVYNWSTLLVWLNNILTAMGINFYAFEKTLNLLLSSQNVDSGRNYLIAKLFEQVHVRELIVGKGVGYVESILEIYSHNLFVQSLFEGGVLFLSLLGFVLWRLFKLIGRSGSSNEFILLGTVAVFGQLMLSNVYWLNPIFWFLFYLVFYSIDKVEG